MCFTRKFYLFIINNKFIHFHYVEKLSTIIYLIKFFVLLIKYLFSYTYSLILTKALTKICPLIWKAVLLLRFLYFLFCMRMLQRNLSYYNWAIVPFHSWAPVVKIFEMKFCLHLEIMSNYRNYVYI